MTTAVEQLENGVRVQCTDGAIVVCKSLTLQAAKQIITLWRKRFAPRPPVSDPPTDAERRAVTAWAIGVADARVEVVDVFGTLYPELAAHISPGDVESLLPDFFWLATGAAVPATTDPLTGTPPTPPTAPPGASSPTP
ncbi:MAG TPA: hypothetical protein VKQ05_12930 [Gemmatimonadales bacterium]|nr:hypothetical protein [Gemmatimonadales bacterium]